LLITPLMIRAIVVVFTLIASLAACTQRAVCPAYQSAFIYDKDQLRKKFSYFQNDTVPKVFTASKNKYLIAEAMPYRKKVRSLQTVVAKPVMVNVPDSISGKPKSDSVITADLDRAARSVIDSTLYIDDNIPDSVVTQEDDSTYVISKDREVRLLKYNTPDTIQFDSIANKYVVQKPKYYVEQIRFHSEQDSYMWYLRHSLVLPDVRLAKLQSEKGGKGEAPDKKSKKGKRSLNPFRKKQKTDIDSAELELNPNRKEEFDFIDTTAQVAPEYEDVVPNKKKDILSNEEQTDIVQSDSTNATNVATDGKRSKKKKKKSSKDVPPKKKDDKKKPEDEDDGF
jgi:hypothetical protein